MFMSWLIKFGVISKGCVLSMMQIIIMFYLYTRLMQGITEQ